MSTYSDVTEQDLINLRELAEQQKNQRVKKFKKKILRQTHDIKLAESSSPITKKLEEVKESTQDLGDFNKKSQPETPQLAIENSQPQLPTENNQDDTQPGVLYDVLLKNTLTNMKLKQKGFFQRKEDKRGQRIWNGIPVAKSSDSRVEIKSQNFNITPNHNNVFTDTTGKPLNKLDKMENLTYEKLLKTLNYGNYKHKSGEKISVGHKITKIILKPINLPGGGVKIINPSNINDIYTKLEILLGIKLSGHTDTLTEASILIDEFYKKR